LKQETKSGSRFIVVYSEFPLNAVHGKALPGLKLCLDLSKVEIEAFPMTFSSSQYGIRPVRWFGVGLSTVLMVSCASIPGGINQTTASADRSELAETAESMGSNAATTSPTDLDGGGDAQSSQANAESTPSISQPQLVKQAHLTVVLPDPEAAADQIQQMVTQAQGDLLGLQDYRSPAGVAHEISLTLRIPQNRLNAVLANIRDLGTVQQQTITVEDVSNQIVDLEARLINLRKSEAALLNIMERSGDIADVLEVSRELSQVRESIERIDAQQQTLKQRVAYSHIYLTLKTPTAAVAPLRPAGETLGNTWQAATRSFKAFTLGGLKVGLWLLAYSPYLVLVAMLGFGVYRLRRPRPIAAVEGDGNQE
jgi:hypothetical protein